MMHCLQTMSEYRAGQVPVVDFFDMRFPLQREDSRGDVENALKLFSFHLLPVVKTITTAWRHQLRNGKPGDDGGALIAYEMVELCNRILELGDKWNAVGLFLKLEKDLSFYNFPGFPLF